MMGKGFAVIPTGTSFCAPIKGKINLIAETGHAFSIINKNGLEVLVHVGLDTVTLNAKKDAAQQLKGFKILAKVGDKVKPGQPIVEADLATIKQAGLDTTTPVIAIFNNKFMTKEKEIEILKSKVGVIAGEPIMVIKK
jgi:glucose-specific phosphotransferase system IIA component